MKKVNRKKRKRIVIVGLTLLVLLLLALLLLLLLLLVRLVLVVLLRGERALVVQRLHNSISGSSDRSILLSGRNPHGKPHIIKPSSLQTPRNAVITTRQSEKYET